MDSHHVSLLARRCGVRREQISGDLGQAWLASDSCPGSRSNEPVKLLWILSEPEKGVSRKMLDKLTQTSGYINQSNVSLLNRSTIQSEEWEGDVHVEKESFRVSVRPRYLC